MKVLHLPTPIGGAAIGLAQGERKVGLNSRVLYKYENWVGYPTDIVLKSVSKDHLITEFLINLKHSLEICNKYDIYHFNYGSTILDYPEKNMHLLDLPLYKKKKIFVSYNGCDARQKYKRIQQAEICPCKYAACYDYICNNIAIEEKKAKRIKKFEEYGAQFFCYNPDLMYVLPKNTLFLPYAIARWYRIQCDTNYNVLEKKKITVVHAPTERVAKGTEAVISAFESLQKKFPERVEMKLVENIPNAEALKLYRKADIIVDQLRFGWYGGFAVEAMKMGKPVLVYINEADLHFIPKQMEKDCMEAFIIANEFTIEEVLRECIENPRLLLKKREAQLEYVHKWHNPIFVAGITKAQYEK